MKRSFGFIGLVGFILVIFSACQQNGKPESYEEKKKQLNEFRNELVDLRQKVRKLEDEVKEIEEEKGIRETNKPVKVETIAPVTYKHSIDVQGLVESDENVNISSEVSGMVEQVTIDIGDRVQKGDVIARVDDQTIRDQLEELKTNYALARETYEKQKNLWDQKIGSEIQYLQAKNRKESLENQMTTLRSRLKKYTITSPINGKVDNVSINQGEMISPGLPVARIVDASEVKVVADVSERYVTKIKEGDSVRVFFPAIGSSINTVIDATGQVINRENRTFKVVIKIDNKDRALKPNLLSKISIYDFVKRDAIVIPTRLVHFKDDATYVYTATQQNGDTVAIRKTVTLSLSNAEKSLVESGLAKGEKVIVEGHDKVSDGEKISIVR